MALLISAGVTFGASLKVFVQDAHKREEMELEQRGFFRDLFELAEEKFHTVEEAFKGVFNGNFLKANKGRANEGGIYVHEYSDGHDFAYWDLCDVNVSSNLGGMGPDTDAAEELRFSNVMQDVYGVGSVDLVVTATSSYTPKNASANGIYHCFGIINVASGTLSDFEFGFKKSGTPEPVTFSDMYFTLYDMDTGKHHEGIEEVTVYDDVDEIFKEDDCAFDSSGNLSTGLKFTANTVGTGGDNPDLPINITDEQRKKSVTAQYKEAKTWKVSFDVEGGDGGRNFMFAGESPPTDDSTCRIAGDCVIWGDPHIITFDATQKLAEQYPNKREFLRIRNRKMEEVNVFGEGNFWIVKSKDVHIQGRYNLRKEHAKRTVLGGLAIGGPFLKNNTFIVRPLTGKITWNGQEVLKHLGSKFTKHKLIHAKYHKGAESVSDGRKGDGIDITLPGSVKLTVNRFERGLAVKISMCAREWQDGQCGNFNGDAGDDKQDFLMSRVQPLRRKEKLPWREHRHLAASAKKHAKVHHHHK